MDKYYYLLSQLPLLQFEKETYLSEAGFLEEAKKWLSQKDFSQLKKARIDFLENKGNVSFLRDYKNFELKLRKELLSYRQSRLNKKEIRPWEILSKSLLEGNPLEVEKKLLFRRWQEIEDLAVDFSFSREAVFAYFLKLQILIKIFESDKEKGAKKFDSLTEVGDEKIR